MQRDDQPTALYRFFAEDDRLLYVGITSNVQARFYHHKHTAKWADEAARSTVEWFPTRSAADQAETDAVVNEHPIHNVRKTNHVEIYEPEINRDRVRAQVLASRRAQGLQDSVPASRFLADLAAEILDQETD